MMVLQYAVCVFAKNTTICPPLKDKSFSVALALRRPYASLLVYIKAFADEVLIAMCFSVFKAHRPIVFHQCQSG